ncbi:endocuticle structural glycoprotein ABD-5-like [Toxorhynchites rutilus septentrionalis]|uniref:endocuticle structural glycoprotein ABD-5-like n=1 Tax=Toxorhynchites rutilus septentrionalis TaxID=329112 RepID=UPI0024783B8A|nr:endocuticle structural glycoprotein ABD-5-like [Toxorhynchites rutilus septentrionalis]
MKFLIVFALFAVAAVCADTKILRMESVQDGEGTYKFAYETDDGTSRVEQGDQKNEQLTVQGNFQYVGDDGQQYKVKYVADGETGFRAEGDHIPNEYVQKLSTL